MNARKFVKTWRKIWFTVHLNVVQSDQRGRRPHEYEPKLDFGWSLTGWINLRINHLKLEYVSLRCTNLFLGFSSCRPECSERTSWPRQTNQWCRPSVLRFQRRHPLQTSWNPCAMSTLLSANGAPRRDVRCAEVPSHPLMNALIYTVSSTRRNVRKNANQETHQLR